MSVLNLVKVDDIKTIEEYAVSLLVSTVSLRTIEQYHVTALKQGLVGEAEEEVIKTISYEIHRLLALYQALMESVLEKTKLDEGNIIERLKNILPNVQLPPAKKGRGNAGHTSA